MNDDQLKTLDELLKDRLQEKKKIEKELSKNLNRIKEIDTFLDSMTEASDFKVFSPRTAESLHREEIKEVREEKDKLEINNDSYYKKIGKIEGDIERISFLIEEHKKTKGNLHLIILDMQEKERGRIARELHDSSIQNLTHLIHGLELSSLYIDKDPIQAKLELESCSKNLRGIIDEMRMVIFNLRPMSFNDLGFDRCLDDYIQNMKESNVDILFVTDIDEVSTKISEYRLLILFRMIQEAVQNSIIHSKSDRIELSVKNKGNQLLVKIRDYGIGFEDGNKKENHFGLSMMQERAKIIHAVFQIHSVLNEGTEITIQVAADE